MLTELLTTLSDRTRKEKIEEEAGPPREIEHDEKKEEKKKKQTEKVGKEEKSSAVHGKSKPKHTKPRGDHLAPKGNAKTSNRRLSVADVKSDRDTDDEKSQKSTDSFNQAKYEREMFDKLF